MNFHIEPDYDALSRRGADLIEGVMKATDTYTLGLATGSTPIGLYKCLVDDAQRKIIDFAGATTFNLDEYRGIGGTHPQSYRYFMDEHLFGNIDIDKSATHVPDGADPDAAHACDCYERAIQEAGGIDIQLLGLGHNGHIGFNEPADEFPKHTHCVDLTQSTIEANSRLFDHIDQVPRQAYTMGIGTIMAARRIVIVANGSDKAEIVKRAFFGPVTPAVPASILQFHPCVDVILDLESAALSKNLI